MFLSLFEKKLSFFNKNPLSSFFDKCISKINKTADQRRKGKARSATLAASGRKKEGSANERQKKEKTKKERRRKPAPLKKDQTSREHRKEKEKPMRYTNSTRNVGKFDGFVNGLAVLVTVALVGAGYFWAIGSFAGVA